MKEKKKDKVKTKQSANRSDSFNEILLYTTPNGSVKVDPNNIFGKDYFEEQLAHIRDIRSSERRFYQKITDNYTQCSADYNVETQATKDFFATVQNKLHWANSSRTNCGKSG